MSNKLTATLLPEVKLISSTENPVETVAAVWIQSRPSQFKEMHHWIEHEKCSRVVTAKDVIDAIHQGVITKSEVDKIFRDAVAADLPISESIHFTWGFSALPIEWREQAVRKRLWGFWLTSTREFDMTNFASEGRYQPPPASSVSLESLLYLEKHMEATENAYNCLIDEFGWPPEKARKVLPLCLTNNGTMFSNYRTLRDTAKARTCFIAQIDIWGPFVLSLAESLRSIDPVLADVLTPPCFKAGEEEFIGCKYDVVSKNRLTNKDDYAPCPLYMHHNGYSVNSKRRYIDCSIENGTTDKFVNDGVRLLDIWGDVWNRDVFTGKLR